MLTIIKSRFDPRKARISKQVIWFVFGSIIAIEGILLIPSIFKRQQQLIEQVREITAGKIAVIMQTAESESSDHELLSRVSLLQNQNKPLNLIGKLQHVITGGALYTADGELVGTFGEQPELSFKRIDNQKQKSLIYDDGYDATWLPEKLGRDYILICRHDISTVKSELNYYTLIMSSLVIVLSVLVTGIVWITLKPLLIRPILSLRSDLLKVGEAISQDREPPEFESAAIKRQDELGDVIIAFNRMYQQIFEAISKRKLAEIDLQKSLNKVQAYSQQLDSELQKGRQIQLDFLPNRNNIKHFYHKFGWEIATYFKPARQVAGDFYDLFELPNGNIGLVIADVCDKGVGAALFMALFRSLIRIFSNSVQLVEGVAPTLLLEQEDSISINLFHFKALQAVSLTNDYVAEHHCELGMFATVFFGILDSSTGLLTYINGGHESLIVLNAQGGIKETLEPTGPAVGMLPEASFKINHTYIKPGDILFGYTDGVPEARNYDGNFFTKEKLLSILRLPFSSATALLKHIGNVLKEHKGAAEQYDDITLMAVRWIPKSGIVQKRC
ncbi:PP2C family protein-serine/threonine phosphatase [Pleurocapsa sp. PCC 7319]|uniref:PP2C family protein-serine/threonine phosphatase n=1 Tax=Pleurocapsa sp. PCC 7319 TaxID=118161 RepID=UPI00034827F7|nr:PP2C family protein-serine/threonine phosphatase [Pleurocapsa sp. PCC 7319]